MLATSSESMIEPSMKVTPGGTFSIKPLERLSNPITCDRAPEFGGHMHPDESSPPVTSDTGLGHALA
jgi:hypothetical protein